MNITKHQTVVEFTTEELNIIEKAMDLINDFSMTLKEEDCNIASDCDGAEVTIAELLDTIDTLDTIRYAKNGCFFV
jgi:hypothetical protein